MAILESSVQVLRCFRPERGELTVTEVSQLLAMPKSNVSRLLRAMRDQGLLDSAPDSKAYRPGVLLLELGQIAQAGQRMLSAANTAVRAICDAMGHTGYVSARSDNEMVGLVHHTGQNLLKVGLSLGSRLPVHACATGRSLLALQSDEQVRAQLGERLVRPNSHAPANMEELLKRLAKVRENGYAESSQEADRGVDALAVAVQDPHSAEALSLCITYPQAIVDPQERRKLIELLLQAQSDITRNRK